MRSCAAFLWEKKEIFKNRRKRSIPNTWRNNVKKVFFHNYNLVCVQICNLLSCVCTRLSPIIWNRVRCDRHAKIASSPRLATPQRRGSQAEEVPRLETFGRKLRMHCIDWRLDWRLCVPNRQFNQHNQHHPITNLSEI